MLPPTRSLAFEDDDLGVGRLGAQRVRGRESGDAAADDRDRGVPTPAVDDTAALRRAAVASTQARAGMPPARAAT